MIILHSKYIFRVRLLTVALLVVVAGCRKNDLDDKQTSSVKIISTINEPKQANMIASLSGNLLAFSSSGDLISPALSPELFMLNDHGEVLKKIILSDTVFQHVSAIPGINGGFFAVATSNNLNYISTYQISDLGEIQWAGSFQVKFGQNKNRPAITISKDGNYLVMYQSLGSGYYIWKGDVNGSEIFNKKYPTPNANHYGTGLNYGEKYVNFIQANDTLIITQGVTFDLYEQMIENCFLRAVNADVLKKWYSTNFDSTHIELGSGLTILNGEIVLFGTRSTSTLSEYAGDVFVRTYELDGSYSGQTIHPRVGGTPNIIRKSVSAPDGGFLLIGNNNQLQNNDLVSPTQIILLKLTSDLTVQWTRELETGNPAKGYDVAYLRDGTIGLIALLKENLSENKLMYMRLDASGNLIIN